MSTVNPDHKAAERSPGGKQQGRAGSAAISCRSLLRPLPVLMALAALLLSTGLQANGSCGPAERQKARSSALPDPGFSTRVATHRFLTQATFGPHRDDFAQLAGTDPSDWFLEQLSLPPSLHRPLLDDYLAGTDPELRFDVYTASLTSFTFWRLAIEAPDQLRQRMAFALSQLLVVSNSGGNLLADVPQGISYYQDLLTQHAFGNYRELLEAVTYAPAMGFYLTYIGNEPADPDSGRMPDENYARELLQLFTIGLRELEIDGTPRLDADGQPIETFDNDDITGLARVFTGLVYDARSRYDEEALARPLRLALGGHSPREKTFLGATIPAGTPGADSIDQALDIIMGHPNVAPFVSRQLIQRFTTSNPDPDYVRRVARVFNCGQYTLPGGQVLGDGRKGELDAVLGAILFDPAVRQGRVTDPVFGKLREPILRFTAWARAFDADAATPEYNAFLWDAGAPEMLGQHPYRSPSVFNFYRPGFSPPGTRAGARGMTAPEFQLLNASTIPGYANFMTYFVFEGAGEPAEMERLREEFEGGGAVFDADRAEESFAVDYLRQVELAEDPAALVAELDELLAYGSLSAETRQSIEAFVASIPLSGGGIGDQGRWLRVGYAVLMTMTAPEFLVQR